MDFEQFDSVIKDTCINYGVPLSDLNGVTSAFSDFVEEHAEAKALDTSVFLCCNVGGCIQGRTRKRRTLTC